MSDSFEFGNLDDLDGQVSSVILIDKDGRPNRVIQQDKGFTVTVDWDATDNTSSGSLAWLDGDWTVYAFAESIGPGPEKQIGQPVPVAYNPGVAADGNTGAWSATVTVQPNELEGDNPPTVSGMYSLGVLITHTTAAGTKTMITGFGKSKRFEIRTP